MAPAGLTGILLVGGASRRFGSAKALARLGDETLAERAWRVLGEACDERLAVGKEADGLPLPFPLLDDGTDVRAPLAGVAAGLRAAAHEVCVVVPVDCPAVTPEVLRALATACRDAAVPPSGPLPAAYRRSALPVFERRLADGRLALRDALHELDVAVVAVDAEALVNVNTTAELRLVARRLGYTSAMPRKNEDERERQAKGRAAKEQGRSPSEGGATQGAEQQRDHSTRGSHPEQKTTHPR